GGRRLARGGGGGGGHRGGPAMGVDGGLAGDVGPVPVDRQRGPDVLCLRLGVPPARSRLPRRLPRVVPDDPAGPRPVAVALAPVPARVRRRPDQVAGPRVLARSHLPVLPPRDAAPPEPAQLVFPP